MFSLSLSSPCHHCDFSVFRKITSFSVFCCPGPYFLEMCWKDQKEKKMNRLIFTEMFRLVRCDKKKYVALSWLHLNWCDIEILLYECFTRHSNFFRIGVVYVGEGQCRQETNMITVVPSLPPLWLTTKPDSENAFRHTVLKDAKAK